MRFLNRLECATSIQKLDAYRSRLDSDDGTRVFAHFMWNIALCESLYPVLQGLEVALRNRIHAACTRKFKTEAWYNLTLVLDQNEIAKVDDAEKALKRKNRPPDSGHMIEELRFGFWTSLLDKRYERKQTLWPSLLKPVFPGAPARERTRTQASRRINKIRLLRNRVFHHGSIWHWQDLAAQHETAHEVTRWCSEEMSELIQTVDRFQVVYSAGVEPFLQHVQRCCEKMEPPTA